MRCFIILVILGNSILASAQDANIFYDRSFWKTSPDVEAVNQKIAGGNDPVALNPNAFDAITYAILENAPLKTIKHLLSIKGNEVDKMTHDGRNYLMWAVYKGNLELIQFLIDEGSQKDIIDDHGYNLMTFAAVGGQSNPEVYDLLLKNGAKADDANREGANALLLLAPRLQDDALIKYFQDKGLDIASTDHEGNGMFNYAARMGNIEMMDKFIKMGLAYKNLNKVGGNAMIFASQGFRGQTNPLSVFEYLESKGVEANVVTKEGLSPLHAIAYRNKDYGVFEYFINKGVDVNQTDSRGNTAFLNAVNGSNFEIAKKLAPMVKDLNHKNKDGHSALTYAVRRNAGDFANFLLSKGASVSVKDKKGNSLAYHLFDVYGANNQKAFDKNLETLKSKGVRFTEKQSGGNTLLHLAVEKGETFLVEKAVKMGVGVNEKNEDGLTALHLAAMKAADKELLILLIEHGADKTILTDFDESVFDLASENELLKEAGVNIEFLK